MTMRAFQNAVHRKLLRHGWRVQRAWPAKDGWESGRAYWEPAYLRRLNYQPRTLIDVGVAHGTTPLYEAFPDAYLVLVEPLAEFTNSISAILAHRKGVHHATAAGAERGKRTIYIEPRLPERSAFTRRLVLEQSGDATPPRTVPVQMLDDLMAAHPCPKPYGLKIDAEGCEMEVIAGAGRVLEDTAFVIAEVGVPRRFENGYRFADLIGAMERRGFHMRDILDIGRAPSSDVIFLDLVFEHGPA